MHKQDPPEPNPASTAPRSNNSSIDRPIFALSLIALLGGSVLLLLNPEASLEKIHGIHGVMKNDLGWAFLLFVFVGVGWLGWLAMSEHGNKKLGPDDAVPSYSTLSWLGMLFCAGIGSNLLYFGSTEWIGYSLQPPPLSNAAPGSPQALDWAGAYSFFHWGISAWGTYAIATIPIAWTLHVKGSSSPRLSTSCEGLFNKQVEPTIGKLIDILFIFGLVAGIGTSLGIGIPMVSAVAGDLLGVERSMVLDTWILIGLTALFSFSVSAGLDKGIKLLSDINVGLAFLLLSIVLLAGPTSFIVNQALDSLGVLFQNFISMSLTTDAGGTSTFAQDNTVFFWAWWMAWAPFMGLFIARISGGRTLRQVIVGVIGGGSLGCWVGFSILGHATMHLLSSGDPAMTALYESAQSGSGVDAPAVVIALLNAQPVAVVFKGLFFVLCFIFVATSLDSAAFTLASTATQDLHIEDQPARWHRLVWAFVLSATALSLMYVGGLQVLQAASVALGLPILVIMGMLVVVFMRRMNKKTD